MMKTYRKYTLFLFLISTSICNALQPKYSEDKAKVIELLKKSKKFYDNTKQFTMTTNYSVYLGNSNKELDTYDGIFVKKNSSYYSRIGKTEFLVTPEISIKIDNESKLLQYTKNKLQEILVYDLLKFVENFDKFKITSNANEFICTLDAREITFNPYSKIIITLSKKDFSIAKQDLFLISPISSEDSDKKSTTKNPRLQVTFTKINTTMETQNYFKIGDYIELKKGKYVPVKKYKMYQIVD